MISSRVRAVFLAGVATAAVVACTSTRDPLAVGPQTNINFWSASVALLTWPRSPTYPPPYDFVYIDSYDTSRTDVPNLWNGSFPFDPTQDGSGLPYTRVLYMHLAAGSHRLRFTNPERAVIVDTTLGLGGNQNTVLYLTDSLQHNMHVVAVDESAPGVAGAVRIRVVQLSPDVGPLGAFVFSDTGTVVRSNLPQAVAYDSVTPYIVLDPSLASSDGNVYVSFFAGGDSANVVATAVVPFSVNRSYHVVVEGLANPETFTYPDPANPGQTITDPLAPSIAAYVRAVQ